MAKEQHTKEIFTGPASAMRDSEFMATEDLMAVKDGQIDLTIERVERHTNVKFADGRNTPELFALRFKGAQRVLKVNAAHKTYLKSRHGIKTVDWIGKRVQLYLDECRRPDLNGAMGPCIRLRDPKPVQPKQEAQPEDKTVEQLEVEAADRAAEQREGGEA